MNKTAIARWRLPTNLPKVWNRVLTPVQKGQLLNKWTRERMLTAGASQTISDGAREAAANAFLPSGFVKKMLGWELNKPGVVSRYQRFVNNAPSGFPHYPVPGGPQVMRSNLEFYSYPQAWVKLFEAMGRRAIKNMRSGSLVNWFPAGSRSVPGANPAVYRGAPGAFDPQSKIWLPPGAHVSDNAGIASAYTNYGSFSGLLSGGLPGSIGRGIHSGSAQWVPYTKARSVALARVGDIGVRKPTHPAWGYETQLSPGGSVNWQDAMVPVHNLSDSRLSPGANLWKQFQPQEWHSLQQLHESYKTPAQVWFPKPLSLSDRLRAVFGKRPAFPDPM